MAAFLDLETGSGSSASAGDRRTPMAEWVGTTMSPDKEMYWLQRIGTKPLGPGGHYNPHGLLAAQRYVCEKTACEHLLANNGCVVVDVGGAPHRTYEHLRERGRYMMPPVVAGDRTRRGRCPPGAAENVCDHRFEECTCYEGMDHVYLFVHSVYYLDPMVLWVKLSSERCKDAISVEHHFSDMFGGFYGEAHWAISRDVITMHVAGNARPYVHFAAPWQRGWVGARGEAFDVEVIHVLDDCTRVVRITAGHTDARPDQPLVWGEVEADITKTGPVQFSSAVRNAVSDNAKFTQVTFDVHKVKKFGPVLYTDFLFRGETVSLSVPVNAVSEVAREVVNRPRTPELFSEISYKMKNRLGRSRIPPAEAAATLAAIVALGFVVNLHNEMDLLHTMTSRFSWAMKAHSTLLQFGSVAVRWWPWVLFGVALVIAGAATGAALEDEEWQRWLTVSAALLSLVLCWGCGRGVLALSSAFRDYQERNWRSSYGDNESPRAPLLGHGFRFTRHLSLPGSRYVKPVATDVTGRVAVGATREAADEPNRALLSGIVVDGALPNVLATTQEAELSAVTNRILATRRNPDETALNHLPSVLERMEFKGIKKGVDTSFDYFKKWLTKLSKTYPASYVALMEETWKQNQGCEAEPVATKGFLKVEKAAAAVKVDHAKPTKPRLVQPPEDVDKAIVGPVIWQLWERIRRYWDGVQTPVMYCSGYSCAEIGDRVDRFVSEWGPDVVGVNMDMASYDATLGIQLQRIAFRFYEFVGMPVWMVSWLTRIRSRGTTPNSVTYCPTRVYDFDDEPEAKEFAQTYRKAKIRVFSVKQDEVTKRWLVEVEDVQMCSGRMDTNLTDTVVLVAVLLARMPLNVPFLLLVCGDDAFLLLREQDQGIVEALVQYVTLLGMNPETKVSRRRCDWEFCSKLFWFSDENGITRTVLGSKPFRGIARMGVNSTLPGAANAAAAALSVRIDSGHVPFLGAFADRTYELCAQSKIRPVGKAEWSAVKGDRRYPPSHLNYALCQERYGLGKEQEDEFKARLASLTSVPCTVDYLPIQDALAVDEA